MSDSSISRRDMLRAAVAGGAGLGLLFAESAGRGDCQAADTGTDKVLFEFYSSCEQEMSFAFVNTIGDEWRFVKMQKDGNRFSVHHPVDKEIWYEFVASPNVWYKRDPFNQYVDSDHPYLKRGSTPVVTHRNLDVTYVPGTHFDYFTTGDGKKIEELEVIYAKLTNDLLAMFDPNLTPVHGKKIRYYGGMFGGTYATSYNAEIIEHNDFPNSHEIIHTLMHQYPHYAPFAEGIAQCFQKDGNQRPLTEPNCSLAAREKSKTLKLWDVLSDFGQHPDYHIVGSFIYYHLFIVPLARKPFIAFIKEFKRDEKITFQDVIERYRSHMGKQLTIAIASWEKWVSKVRDTSPVYVDWNLSKRTTGRSALY